MAYILPMVAFLVLTQLGAWYKDYYVHCYIARAALVPVLLVWLWRQYTPIRWHYWWLGIVVGVVGIVQWIGVESLLWHLWPSYPLRPAEGDAFNPLAYFADSPAWMLWGFIAIRWATATITVPIMEELFWRDYLWRMLIAPADHKLAEVGEYHALPLLVIPLIFAFVHPGWAATSIVWALMIGGLLAVTRSLGACIIAHGVTNLLLGAYVLWTQQWYWW